MRVNQLVIKSKQLSKTELRIGLDIKIGRWDSFAPTSNGVTWDECVAAWTSGQPADLCVKLTLLTSYPPSMSWLWSWWWLRLAAGLVKKVNLMLFSQFILGFPCGGNWTGCYHLGRSPRSWQSWRVECKGGFQTLCLCSPWSRLDFPQPVTVL